MTRRALLKPLGAVLVAAGLCLPSTDARGDDADDARAHARTLANAGDEAFAAGRCRAAIEQWQEAERVFSAPTLRLRVARCRALLGEVRLATEALESILALPSDPTAPEAYADARARAEHELTAVRARIGSLVVRVEGEESADALVIHVGSDQLAGSHARFEVDPGKHLLRVSAGESEHSEWVDVEDGEHRAVDLRLRVERAAAKTSPVPMVGWLVAGVGGAALGAAAVTGGLALVKSDELESVCGPDHDLCTAGASDDVDHLAALSIATDVLLIAGGAVAAIGGVIVLTAPAAEQPAPRVFVAPLVGGLALRGSF